MLCCWNCDFSSPKESIALLGFEYQKIQKKQEIIVPAFFISWYSRTIHEAGLREERSGRLLRWKVLVFWLEFLFCF